MTERDVATTVRRRRPFEDAYAQRLIGVMDDRIERTIRSGARVEETWGTVASVSGDGQTASAYLYGDITNPSVGFRVRGPEVVAVGDKVKVNMDARGDRWIEDRYVTTAYRKIEIDMGTGEIRTGDGTVAPSARITSSGLSLAHSDLTGVTSDQHHNRAHSHSNAADEDDLAPVSLTIGSTPDIRFTRSGTKVLVVDDGAGGGLTTIDLLGAVALRFGGDTSISRTVADRLDLASGDSLMISDTGQLQWSDIALSRGAANRLDLASGDSLRLSDTSELQWSDVVLSRGAANRLDLASGDNLRIVSGTLELSTDARITRNITEGIRFTDASGTTLNYLDFMEAKVKWGGSSFPSSPLSGDMFYRTDRDIIYTYDGTRWLSGPVALPFQPQVFPPHTGDAAGVSRLGSLATLYGQTSIWVETFYGSSTQANAGSASHYWEMDLLRTDSSGTRTVVATVNTQGNATGGRWYPLSADVSAVFTSDQAREWDVDVDLVAGTPGNLHQFMGMIVRFIG